MPTITVNRQVLEKIIGKKLSESELKYNISMIGTDLESMDDTEITVEIFPNRPDMLSEQGFGRALNAFLGVNPGLQNYKIKSSGSKVIVSKDMKGVRPYTVCAIVKNLKLNDEKVRELIQIQEKLHVTYCRKRKKAAIGIYPLDRIKLPIYFSARAPEDIIFRPLEAKKDMTAVEILDQHPTGIEYRDLVKGLKKYAVFHDSNNEILSFTPVINSHFTGKINDMTKEAFVEVSGFDLRTAKYVLNILVTSMSDMGADIYSMEVVYPDKTIVTPDLSPRKMKVDFKYINKWLGLNLDEKQFKTLFERMGYGYENKIVLIPAYRPDILHMVDLAEDIAIAYGYDKFDPVLPSKATTAAEDELEIFKSKVAEILIGLNMLELSTYHLTSRTVQFMLTDFVAKDYVSLANAMSEEYDTLRYWMMPSLLNVLKDNKHNEYPQHVFELGKVFRLGDTETGVQEKNHLAVALCGDVDYTKIRQVLDYLMRAIDVKYEIKETQHPSFIPGRVGRVLVGNKEIGFLGEVSPQVMNNFELETPTVGLEIDISLIFSTAK